MPALFRRPAGLSSGAWAKLFNWWTRARDYYFSQPRLKFEAITLGLAVLFGLILMPAFIYAAGYYTLKPYAHGGLFALYFDFFKGLIELRESCWIVVAGPFVVLCLVRLFRWALGKV